MFKCRVHWFAKQFPEDELHQIATVCSNGVLQAIKENDLKAYFIFKLKERAYEEALLYKRTLWGGNDWIHYPEDTDHAIDLAHEVQYHLHNVVAGC
jgi:hypothetical protein